MFSVQTSRKFVQFVVAAIIVLSAMLTIRGSASLTAPRAHDSSNLLRSGLLAADDFTNGFRQKLSDAASI